MKTSILYIKTGLVLSFVLIAASQKINAQEIDAGTFDVTGQWQFNAPVSNNFSDVASGWGMNVEGMYNLNANWAAGAFMSWHTNNKYEPRNTYYGQGSAINMDSQNSLFQLPFGLAGKYKMLDGNFVPFAGLKLGANYIQERQYSNIFEWDDDSWGFFVSPEIGITIYPTDRHFVGFNIVGYYSYSTNKNDYFDINGVNNIGFRLGVIFKIQ